MKRTAMMILALALTAGAVRLPGRLQHAAAASRPPDRRRGRGRGSRRRARADYYAGAGGAWPRPRVAGTDAHRRRRRKSYGRRQRRAAGGATGEARRAAQRARPVARRVAARPVRPRWYVGWLRRGGGWRHDGRRRIGRRRRLRRSAANVVPRGGAAGSRTSRWSRRSRPDAGVAGDAAVGVLALRQTWRRRWVVLVLTHAETGAASGRRAVGVFDQRCRRARSRWLRGRGWSGPAGGWPVRTARGPAAAAGLQAKVQILEVVPPIEIRQRPRLFGSGVAPTRKQPTDGSRRPGCRPGGTGAPCRRRCRDRAARSRRNR